MEKEKTKKKKILRMLPKALSFHNPPFSPSRDRDRDFPSRFSGPIVSLIPREARARRTTTAETPQEPTSPKVSCLGQIKQRRHNNNDDKKKKEREKTIVKAVAAAEEGDARRSRGRLPSKEPTKRNEEEREREEERTSSSGGAPALGQMRRLASGRSSLSSFDWTAHQVTPEEDNSRPEEQRRDEFDEEEDDDEDEEGLWTAFSNPLAVGEMRPLPKKEINLWKRRTTAPPRPLSLRPPPDP